MNILVVVDMQNDFVTGALGTREAVDIIPRAVNKIKEYGDAIFVTLDTHDDDYMDTLEGKKLPIPHCRLNSYGWFLNQDISEAYWDRQANKTYTKMLQKNTFGSFTLYDEIVQYILTHHVEEITLIGLCTDICVVSNALILRAKFPNMKIIVDAACCAGTTPANHQKALDIMQMCQIDIINNSIV